MEHEKISVMDTTNKISTLSMWLRLLGYMIGLLLIIVNLPILWMYVYFILPKKNQAYKIIYVGFLAKGFATVICFILILNGFTMFLYDSPVLYLIRTERGIYESMVRTKIHEVISKKKEKFRCIRGVRTRGYSVGPDNTGSNGSPSYDATNGTVSYGDILLGQI